MAVCLLDANVLFPLLWFKHVHHDAAHRWFSPYTGNWATCPLTQCAFVRLASNPQTTSDPVTVPEAIAVLRGFVANPSHVFWHDDIQITNDQLIPTRRLRGHKQVTDAYLFGLCVKQGGQLVTFDRGFSSLVPANEQQRVLVLTP